MGEVPKISPMTFQPRGSRRSRISIARVLLLALLSSIIQVAGGVNTPAEATQTPGFTYAIQLATGPFQSCAILIDNSVQCNGTIETVPAISNAIEISSGSSHACALINGGSVYCWGANGSGQLGNGTTSLPVTTAVKVLNITTAINISANMSASDRNRHSCAVLADGTVKCWGLNSSGQLGDGSITDRSTPVSVSGATGVTQVSAGGIHTCILKSNGTVSCWGMNTYGQLGNGTSTASRTPVSVDGISDAIAIGSGENFSCALLSTGAIKCWGQNTSGNLGNGSSLDALTPTSVSGISTATEISVGPQTVCALLQDATAKCWGANESGQTGNGLTSSAFSPVAVVGLTGIAQISAGYSQTLALMENGEVYGWGSNTSFKNRNFVGPGVQLIATPAQRVGLNQKLKPTPTITGETKVGATLSTVIGNWDSGTTLQYQWTRNGKDISGENGTTYITGDLDLGQAISMRVVSKKLGYFAQVAIAEPVFIDGVGTLNATPNTTFASKVAVGNSYACAIQLNQSIQCVGENSIGQLGVGSYRNETSTVTVTGITSALDIVASYDQTCALLEGGGVACWGYKELGNNSANSSTTPVSVTGISNAVAIQQSDLMVCALLTDASLKCWGMGSLAPMDMGIFDLTQLSRGTGRMCAVFLHRMVTCDYSITTIWSGSTAGRGVDIGVRDIREIAAGGNFTCAITDSGSIKCWGTNSAGQLGVGNYTATSQIMTVSGISNAVQISAGSEHVCALLANNTVKCWGRNYDSQVGINSLNNVNTSSPYQINSLSGVKYIALGGDTSFAILSDHSLWGWGRNDYGQAGRPAPLTDVTAPTQSIGFGIDIPTTGSLTISGTLKVGSTLTASGVTWPDSVTISYKWSPSGSSTSIGTSTTLVIGASELGRTVQISATAQKFGFRQTTVTSNPSGTIQQGTFSSIPTPTISGIGEVTQVLTAVPGTWDTGTVISYQWKRNDFPIPAAVSSQYRLSEADSGTSVSVVVTGSRDGFFSESRTSTSISIAPYIVNQNLVGYPRMSQEQADGSANRIIKGISAGDGFTCFNYAPQSVECVGQNANSQLGAGMAVSSSVVPVIPIVSGIYEISSRGTQSCGIAPASTIYWDPVVYCWGNNVIKPTYINVARSSNPYIYPIKIAVTNTGGCTLMNNGSVWCWSGTSTATQQFASVADSIYGKTIAIAAGSAHICAVTSLGKVFCWGTNTSGALGVSTSMYPSSAYPIEVTSISGATSISAGDTHTCAITGAGEVQCWGILSTIVNGITPVSINGVTDAVSIASGSGFACAVLVDKSSKCWGANSLKQLGNGSTSASTSAVAVTGLANVKTLALGASHSCALLTDGTARCWGSNSLGQLGTYLTSTNSDLTNIRLSKYVDVAVGMYHTCALAEDSNVYCIGGSGKLGDGTDVASTDPVLVKGITGVSSIEAGPNHTCAVTRDGKIYCWGSNSFGQLGNGTNVNALAPTLVSGITDAISVSAGSAHTCAITGKIYAKVYCWGKNQYGQLGNPYLLNANSNTPVLVANQLDIQPQIFDGAKFLSAGYYHTCFSSFQGSACWGWGGNGQVGNYPFKNSSSATSLVNGDTLRNHSLSVGQAFSCAVTTLWNITSKANPNLSCWGYWGQPNYEGSVVTTLATNAQTVSSFMDKYCWQTTGTFTWSCFNYSGTADNSLKLVNMKIGEFHSCGVSALNSGSIYCQGNNWQGALGSSYDTATAGFQANVAFAPPQTSIPTVTLSGTPNVGQALNASSSGWDSGVTVSYRWYRGYNLISNATSSSYTVVSADLGNTITVRAIGSKNGFMTLAMAASETKTVTLADFQTTSRPTIQGTVRNGQTLSATVGSWDAGTSLAYQWKADGVAIAGATTTSLKLIQSLIGKQISFTTTATKSGYNTLILTSEISEPVAVGQFTLTPTPTIEGFVKVDRTLTITPGTWDTSVALSYFWKANGVVIPGANTRTLVLDSGHLGLTIQGLVTGTLPGYETVTVGSVITAPVANGEFLSTPKPTISGSLDVGQTLTAIPGNWPSNTTFQYQWIRDSTNIAGETSTTYVLTSADETHTISVRLTASKLAYTTATVTSDPTATIVDSPNPAVLATFTQSTSVSGGATAQVSNFSNLFTYNVSIGSTNSTTTPTVEINSSGLITVSGMSAGSTSSIIVTTSRTDYVTGMASLSLTSLRNGLSFSFATPTRFANGYTSRISNYDPNFSYSITVLSTTSSTTPTPALSSNGSISVTTMTYGSATEISVTATRIGYISKTETLTANALAAPLFATFDTTTVVQTIDGFKLQISNFDSAYSWSATSSVGGQVVIGLTGLITVRGIAPATLSTVSVFTTREGYALGGVQSPAISSYSGTAYRVSFLTRSSTSLNFLTLAAGAEILWPEEPTSTGFTFAGWSDGVQTYRSNESYTVTSNVIFFAMWTPSITTKPLPTNTAVPVALTADRTVGITLPTGAIAGSQSVSADVRAIGTPEDHSAGRVGVKIEVRNDSGTAITSFSEPLKIDLGAITPPSGTALAWSSDDVTWSLVPILSGTTLPVGQPDGYYIEAGTSHVIILTRHLTSFGVRTSQSPITSSGPTTLVLPATGQISFSGGNGDGEVSYSSNTPAICAVNDSGLVSTLDLGNCIITISKQGNTNYVGTSSTTHTIVVTSAGSSGGAPSAPAPSGGGGGGGGGVGTTWFNLFVSNPDDPMQAYAGEACAYFIHKLSDGDKQFGPICAAKSGALDFEANDGDFLIRVYDKSFPKDFKEYKAKITFGTFEVVGAGFRGGSVARRVITVLRPSERAPLVIETPAPVPTSTPRPTPTPTPSASPSASASPSPSPSKILDLTNNGAVVVTKKNATTKVITLSSTSSSLAIKKSTSIAPVIAKITSPIAIRVSVKIPSGELIKVAEVKSFKAKTYSAPILGFKKTGTYVLTFNIGKMVRTLTVKVS